MSLIQINKKIVPLNKHALFTLGFRPFFLAASFFALVSISSWILVYFSYVSLPLVTLTIFQWHSHEMIYGYSLAVIAGFLLTAIMNWTDIQTVRNKSLAALVCSWLVARILFLFGSSFLTIAAVADLSFVFCLMAATAHPIFKAKQWAQLGILAKVLLLALGNLLFYLGAFGFLDQGVYIGTYAGLYIIVAMILTIGGRVIPTFIKNGLDYQVEIPNPSWITTANLVIFLLFFINQLFINNQTALGSLSILLFLINSLRLILWHTPGIWKKPLLWGLYLSIAFINLGFLLFALTAYIELSSFLAVHAFAFGGIGLATLSMMSRVTLGHTGRNVRTPPAMTCSALVVLTSGALIRVLFPVIDQRHYGTWIFLAQTCWITAFALFFVSYSRMLLKPDLTIS